MRKLWIKFLRWLFAEFISEQQAAIRILTIDHFLEIRGQLNRNFNEAILAEQKNSKLSQDLILQGNKLLLEEREALESQINASHALIIERLAESGNGIDRQAREIEKLIVDEFGKQWATLETRIVKTDDLYLQTDKLRVEERQALEAQISASHALLCDRITEINNRLAQVLALGFGKTLQDSQKPLSRAPREFTAEDRQ